MDKPTLCIAICETAASPVLRHSARMRIFTNGVYVDQILDILYCVRNIVIPIALSSHKGFGRVLFASILLAYCIVSLYQGLFSSYYDLFVPFNLYVIPIP